MKEHREILGARSGSIHQSAAAQNNLAVYDHICRRLVVTVPRAVQSTGVSAPTVQRVLKEMQALDMLREITGKARNRVFLYQPFVDILEEGL
jgi:Fic family protein